MTSHATDGAMVATLTDERSKKSLKQTFRSKGLWSPGSDTLWLSDNRHWVQLAFGDRSLFAVVQGITSPPRSINLGYPKGTRAAFDAMQSDLLGEIADKRLLAIVSGDYWPTPDNRKRINVYSFALKGKTSLEQGEFLLPRGLTDWGCRLSPDGKTIAWLLAEGGRDAPRAYFGINPIASTDVDLVAELNGWDKAASSPVFRKLSWSSDSRAISVTDQTRRWTMTVGTSGDHQISPGRREGRL